MVEGAAPSVRARGGRTVKTILPRDDPMRQPQIRRPVRPSQRRLTGVVRVERSAARD